MRKWFVLLFLALPGCRTKDFQVDTGGVDSENSETGISESTPDTSEDSGEDTAVDVIDEDGDGIESDLDCDDSDPEIGAAQTWYFDHDGDGFGDPLLAVSECEMPAGYLADGSDCNDLSASAYPGADEVCDGLDNDCNGEVDEDTAIDALTWYADADSDGYGDPNSTASACATPSGYVSDATDCDDGEATTSPGATEACDSVDNDCDGTTDEDDASDASTWYLDYDSDGYGSGNSTTTACSQPGGYSASADDCNDLSASTYPGADEVCDGSDNDCDGTADEADAIDAPTWYADADSDGFGDASSASIACLVPSGSVSDASDCNDSDAAVNPDATEVCDSVDNDCDGVIDEDDAIDAPTWFVDADSDGFGDASSTTEACAQPGGYVSWDTDCDDAVAAVNPSATEVCDAIDNDCDGATDEDDAADASTWYLDYDADGYGDDATATGPSCNAPTPLYVSAGGDCDDSTSDYSPAAALGCDGADYNCDGAVDNDADGDGYADDACGGDDCDDADSTFFPDTGGTCALGTSCNDILDKGYSTGDGLYTIDPDGYGTGDDSEDVYCDMTLADGGWTLIAINTSGGGLSATTIVDNSTFGGPDFLTDYKAQAFSNVDFQDMLFEDGTLHAVYEGVGSGAESYYGFISGLDAEICGSTTTVKFSMTSGTFSGASLCETTLYFNAIDEDGAYNSSCDPNGTYANNATGPVWSAFYNNGCPHDDAVSSSFVSPSSGLPWDTSAPLNMYVR